LEQLAAFLQFEVSESERLSQISSQIQALKVTRTVRVKDSIVLHEVEQGSLNTFRCGCSVDDDIEVRVPPMQVHKE
jgi:hypothetical protein